MYSPFKNTIIGVLAPKLKGPLKRPSTRPISKALLSLETEGIGVIFGDTLEQIKNQTIMHGHVINRNKDEWEAISCPIDALHDRFPSQKRALTFKKALDALTVPMSNPLEMTMLCRDKLMLQKTLESHGIEMPPVIDRPELFGAWMTKWKRAFLKPRFGALGKNVLEKKDGDDLEHVLEGMVDGRMDPTILQKGIDAPQGWAGLSVRLLCQRDKSNWIQRSAVLRRSKSDAVVNVSRGAEAIAAKDVLPPKTCQSIRELVSKTCDILSSQKKGEWFSEMGIDFVIDSQYKPWIIEVNSRPRGRLESLANQDPKAFSREHFNATLAPIRWLAWKSKH